MGRVRRWVAIVLRSIVLMLLVFALADMQWKQLSDRLTVIYVVDESLSIPEDLKPAMIDYVDREIRTHREAHINDRAGVIVFGGDPAIEHPPYDENIQVTYNTESHIDREHTNLAAALRLAQATFPEDSARRVVLLTDGNENVGDGLAQARNLADSGIGIDVVPIRYPPRAEVAVEKVVLPPDVNRGQPFDLRVVLDNVAPPDAKDAAVKGRLADHPQNARPRRSARSDDRPMTARAGQARLHAPRTDRRTRFLHLRSPLHPRRRRPRHDHAEQARHRLHARPRQRPGAADRKSKTAAANSTFWSIG